MRMTASDIRSTKSRNGQDGALEGAAESIRLQVQTNPGTQLSFVLFVHLMQQNVWPWWRGSCGKHGWLCMLYCHYAKTLYKKTLFSKGKEVSPRLLALAWCSTFPWFFLSNWGVEGWRKQLSVRGTEHFRCSFLASLSILCARHCPICSGSAIRTFSSFVHALKRTLLGHTDHCRLWIRTVLNFLRKVHAPSPPIFM